MESILDDRKILGIFSDEERFRILAAVSLGANTLDKIATMTGYDNTKVMKAIVKLESAGIIEKKESGYVFNMELLKELNRNIAQSMPVKSQKTGIDRFIRDGKLVTYPSRPDDQLLVLQHLAELFEINCNYTEKAVNEILEVIHPDFASLRRYLFDKGFFDRENTTIESGRTITVYRRVK
jgi:biotin operon repressor